MAPCDWSREAAAREYAAEHLDEPESANGSSQLARVQEHSDPGGEGESHRGEEGAGRSIKGAAAGGGGGAGGVHSNLPTGERAKDAGDKFRDMMQGGLRWGRSETQLIEA